jgi:hypothetical protein
VQQMRKHLFAICGDEKSAGGLWFLLAENRWEDKLKTCSGIRNWPDRTESAVRVARPMFRNLSCIG